MDNDYRILHNLIRTLSDGDEKFNKKLKENNADMDSKRPRSKSLDVGGNDSLGVGRTKSLDSNKSRRGTLDVILDIECSIDVPLEVYQSFCVIFSE